MNSFLENGYQIIEHFINSNLLDSLRSAISHNTKNQSDYGIRNLHHKISVVNNLATSELVLNTIQQHTNAQSFKLIKAIFFNKSLKYNWSVAWHQDKTIAVKNKVLHPDFKNWTVKQGVSHVQPPLYILEKITTIRIALDSTDSNNGALKVIPRSHKSGILNQQEINQITQQQSAISCSLKAGDALIIHPLILHSSNKSISNNERRTIHLEYSSGEVNSGLDWYC